MPETVEKIGVRADRGVSFWAGKTPCWEMSHCTNMIRLVCPACRYQFHPCWEIEGTYCKLNDYGSDGRETDVCRICNVFRAYGDGKPIQIRLVGRGIETSLAELLPRPVA